MEVSEVLDERREVICFYHLEAGRAWRLAGQPIASHSHLVYAAFEFRCAIERYVIELYLMMDPTAASAPDKFRDFGSLIALVHQDAGNKTKLWRILTFNAVYARDVMGLPFEIAEPKLGKFHEMWSRLSDYCHRQLSVDLTWNSSEWVGTGYAIVLEAEDLLWGVLRTERSGWIQPSSMPIEMQDERLHFISSDDSADALARRLALVKPVVRARLDLQRGGV